VPSRLYFTLDYVIRRSQNKYPRQMRNWYPEMIGRDLEEISDCESSCRLSYMPVSPFVSDIKVF